MKRLWTIVSPNQQLKLMLNLKIEVELIINIAGNINLGKSIVWGVNIA